MADHPGKRRWALPLLRVRIKPATDRADGALGVIRMASPINNGRSRFSRLFYQVPDMTSEVERGASEQGPKSAVDVRSGGCVHSTEWPRWALSWHSLERFREGHADQQP